MKEVRPFLYNMKTKKFIPIEDGFTVGRSDGNYNFNKDKALSGSHFKIELYEGEFYVKDLNSKNGTFLDNVRLPAEARRHINNDSIISAGSQELKFLLYDGTQQYLVVPQGNKTKRVWFNKQGTSLVAVQGASTDGVDDDDFDVEEESLLELEKEVAVLAGQIEESKTERSKLHKLKDREIKEAHVKIERKYENINAEHLNRENMLRRQLEIANQKMEEKSREEAAGQTLTLKSDDLKKIKEALKKEA